MNSTIYIVIAVILSGLGYVYWRKLRQRLNSAFQAYDILFLTLILTYFVGKLMWQLQTFSGNLSLGGIIDPRRGEVAFLILIFLPIFVYQMRMQPGSKDRNWKQHAFFVEVFSMITVLVVATLDIVIRIMGELTIDWWNLIGMAIIAILSLILLARQHSQSKAGPRGVASIMFLQQVGVQFLVWMSPMRSEYKVLSAIIFISMMLIPAIGLIRGELRAPRNVSPARNEPAEATN
jgi:hypothetical protein